MLQQSGSVLYNGEGFKDFFPERTAAYVDQVGQHLSVCGCEWLWLYDIYADFTVSWKLSAPSSQTTTTATAQRDGPFHACSASKGESR